MTHSQENGEKPPKKNYFGDKMLNNLDTHFWTTGLRAVWSYKISPVCLSVCLLVGTFLENHSEDFLAFAHEVRPL